MEPSIEIQRFTPEEAERAIAKLQRRVEECENLRNLLDGDQRIHNAEHHISDTIFEVFGENSPEYQRHRHHMIRRRAAGELRNGKRTNGFRKA